MIRVLLAEDQAMVRGALSALLRLESDLDVIGTAADGEEAWTQPRRRQRTGRRRHRYRNAQAHRS
jgi:two-component system, NarL family, response regulator DesR